MHFWRRTSAAGKPVQYLSALSPKEHALMLMNWYQKVPSGTTFLVPVSVAREMGKSKREDY
jgi:hypothetical protein